MGNNCCVVHYYLKGTFKIRYYYMYLDLLWHRKTISVEVIVSPYTQIPYTKISWRLSRVKCSRYRVGWCLVLLVLLAVRVPAQPSVR